MKYSCDAVSSMINPTKHGMGELIDELKSSNNNMGVQSILAAYLENASSRETKYSQSDHEPATMLKIPTTFSSGRTPSS